MAQVSLRVEVWGSGGELLTERTFAKERKAWAFAEHHLFRGKSVTVTPASPSTSPTCRMWQPARSASLA